jgi:electron transport complex protein RnfB
MMVAAVALGLLAGVRVVAGIRRRALQGGRRSHRREIDAILPQTQCGQCGFAGCRPYAEAIAAGEADINQCPPGGENGIVALAELLGRDPKPLNPENGAEKPKMLAVIDEQNCIGCTLCIQACPVDAILGAAKHMHTVIAKECTGCELCLAPCPVDCIQMICRSPQTISTWKWTYPMAETKVESAAAEALHEGPVSVPRRLKTVRHKTESNRQAHSTRALPRRLTVPLRQHIGAIAKPLVQAGDRC